jgi:hypothetical protein
MSIELRSRSMSDDAIPTIARVECRSEGRADERPVAVVVGSHRLEIVHVLDQAMITTAEAGESVRHRYWVELDDGSRCELIRVMPDGKWLVKAERPSGTETATETG